MLWWSELRCVDCSMTYTRVVVSFIRLLCSLSVARLVCTVDANDSAPKMFRTLPVTLRREDESALKAKLHKRLAFTMEGLHKTETGGSSGVMFG